MSSINKQLYDKISISNKIRRTELVEYYERMKAVRIDNDKSQMYVSELLNIKQPQYNRYETGKRMIPLDLLIIFCEHFRTSSDYILGLPKGMNWPR